MTPKRLIERRQAIGLHQNELAHIAGITPACLSMMEAGKRPITAEMAHRLDQALACAVAVRAWLVVVEDGVEPFSPHRDDFDETEVGQ